MRRKICAVMLVLVAGAMVVSGCGLMRAEPTPTPPPAPAEVTVEPVATEEPAAVPTVAPAETPVEVPEATREGPRLSYNDVIADDVGIETVPAEEFMAGTIIPEHVRISFSGYALQGTFHEPRIHIYPIRELEDSGEITANVVAALRQLLAKRPAAADEIPFLPLFNAAQAMRTQVAYVNFQSGTGVRFLTHYAQALVPVNNNELFYTFQGITRDGAFYVAAILPVSHPTLPADGSAPVPDGEFETYFRDVEQQLDAQDSSTFTPDLSLLDEMIRSLELPQATASAVGEPESPPEGWQTYVNDVYGYQFSYPASATIEELGVAGFPADELPEGMSADEYLAQLRETYTSKFCIGVKVELGTIYSAALPDALAKYGPCGRTGVGYEIASKSETVVVGGESYTATGFEELGPGEELAYHGETLYVQLANGLRIEYGSLPSEAATYADYVATTKRVLLQILASFEQIPASNPPSGVQADPYPGWSSYANTDYGFAFRYPPAWTLEEEPHIVRLRQGTLSLVVGYRRDTEDELDIVGELPPGSFEYRGMVRLLDQEFPKSVLVSEGQDKVVLTGGAVDDLVFTIRLDDLSAEPSSIAVAVQAELDRIVGSFERVTPQQ